jgi:VWFA-related protein
MKNKISLTLFLALSVFNFTRGQTPSSTAPPPQKTDEESIVRINTSLVQVDVTVTDENGNQVIDLKPEDFEIYEDGRPQKLINFSYVGLSPNALAGSTTSASNRGVARNILAPPPVRLRADQVRRTMAVLADDECMSFSSDFAVRDALKKFVAERIEPNDLVGIFTTRRNEMLQQFTTDRNQLALTTNRLTWRPGPNSSIDFFEATRRDFDERLVTKGNELPGVPEAGNPSPSLIRTQYFGLDTPEGSLIRPCLRYLTVLRFLLHDMRTLPGRKAIIFFSDGMSLSSWLEPKLRILTDYANRSGVTIYTVDARGLINTDYIGADEVLTEEQRSQIRNTRSFALFNSQGGLNYLAEATGGTFAHNNNDLGKGLRRALEEQRGYYLIGYRPADETFKNGLRSFRKIEVKVKRPGSRVRTRKGFLGVPDDTLFLAPRPRIGDSELYAALASPLAATDVRLRLTPVFSYDSKGDPLFRVLLHINGSDITLADEANGWKRLTLDVAGVTLGEDGRVANEFTRTHTVRIGPETVDLVRTNGLTYSSDVPIQRFGAYQFRIVVRDASSKRFGTAAQFLQIPDLKKRALTVSDLRLRPDDPVGAQEMPSAAPIEAALSLVLSPSNPAVRRFRPGTAIAFEHLIYNARSDKGGQPHLTTQVRLFREGQEIFSNPEKPLDLSGQLTVGRILNRGRLHLPAQAVAGEYVLQIIVNDDAPGEKRRTTSQWIDFEIVK